MNINKFNESIKSKATEIQKKYSTVLCDSLYSICCTLYDYQNQKHNIENALEFIKMNRDEEKIKHLYLEEVIVLFLKYKIGGIYREYYKGNIRTMAELEYKLMAEQVVRDLKDLIVERIHDSMSSLVHDEFGAENPFYDLFQYIYDSIVVGYNNITKEFYYNATNDMLKQFSIKDFKDFIANNSTSS